MASCTPYGVFQSLANRPGGAIVSAFAFHILVPLEAQGPTSILVFDRRAKLGRLLNLLAEVILTMTSRTIASTVKHGFHPVDCTRQHCVQN